MNVETYKLTANARVPNSRFPLLIYRDAFDCSVVELESRLRANGWPPEWHTFRGLYPRHHFHSDAHEMIAVTRGTLVGRFGGHDGIDAQLGTGDIVVIPAGVAHLGISVSDDLRITGCFPAGYSIHDFRLCYPEELIVCLDRSRRVPIPLTDPVTGDTGHLVGLWERAERTVTVS